MRNRMLILYLFILSLILVIIVEVMGIVLSVKRDNISCQPLDIDYKWSHPFCLSLKKENYLLSSKLSIVLSSTDNLEDEDTILIKDKKGLNSKDIDWKPYGVFIKTDIGNQLFIPKENFPKRN
jgi:energy-converting hydrogenase A subunit M